MGLVEVFNEIHRLLPGLIDQGKSNLLQAATNVDDTNAITPPRSTPSSLNVISPYVVSLYLLIEMI